MNAIPDYPIFQFSLWRTISVARTQQGYAVFEAPDRFWRERLAEAVLRIVGVSLILIGCIQLFLLDTLLQGVAVYARVVLPILFIGTGIGLYLFASRGFRKEVHFEVLSRQISIGRLNTKDRCMVSRQIPMSKIESLFVSRARPDCPLASLNIRVKGFPKTHCLLRGAQCEIEEFHKQLCRDVRIALSVPEEATLRASRIRPTMLPKSAGVKPVSVFRKTTSGHQISHTSKRTADRGQDFLHFRTT